jgi:hypothetical protein
MIFPKEARRSMRRTKKKMRRRRRRRRRRSRKSLVRGFSGWAQGSKVEIEMREHDLP